MTNRMQDIFERHFQ